MILSTADNFEQPIIQSVSYADVIRYQLADDYCYEWKEQDLDKIIKRYRRTIFKDDELIHKRWYTDLASVPPIFEPVGFHKAGITDAAAVPHDRGYQLFGNLKLDAFPPGEYTVFDEKTGFWVDAYPRRWTRLKCDMFYTRLCIAGGMPLAKAQTEFYALRIGAISRKNGFAWYFS